MSIVKRAPSLPAADFARMDTGVAESAPGGVDRIHVDVVDGPFVPNLSMGGGRRHGVGVAMNALRTAVNDAKRDTGPTARSAVQRSQRCNSE